MIEPSDSSDPASDPATTFKPAPTPTLRRPALRGGGDAAKAPLPPGKPGKRKRHPIVATASGILSFLGIAAIALALAWSFGLQRINAPGPLPADKVFAVRPGNDVSVVDQLSDAGIIDNRLLMTAALWMEGSRGSVKSGEYLFKQSASLREVIDTLVSGKQILHAVTVPEGLTSEQVMERLRDNDVLVGDISIAAAEGTLMPDTYKFSRGTTRDQVIRTMQAEQRRVLAEVWSHRSSDSPVRSPFELVTLASIVEKETGRADERPRVAGVFENRLARNMPLQSDPTIVYGLVGGKGTLGRGLLKSEIEQKTPYNTYTNPGLPPGPIANPGRAALEAVINPSRTKDLYFVADGTGGHAFSDNLDQHRANVLRWRQIEKDRLNSENDKAPPAAGPGQPTPARPDQHGEIDTNPAKFDDLLAGAAAPATGGSLAAALPTFAGTAIPGRPAMSAFTATPLSSRPAGQGGVPAANTFNELDVEVAGLKSRDDPAAWDDGGGLVGGPAFGGPADPGGPVQSFPVPAQHLADQRARAVALGLLSANGGAMAASAEAPASGPGAPNAIHLFGKGKIIDASEGTSFDPLKDTTYDLTTAKVVPVLKGLPRCSRLPRPAGEPVRPVPDVTSRPLASMTAFARRSGEGGELAWEIKSVNGKGLDIRLRCPPGFEADEARFRSRIAAVLSRGSVQASLTLNRTAAVPRVVVNEALLRSLVEAVGRAVPEGAGARLGPLTLDGLLAVRGVVEIADGAEAADGRDGAAALALLDGVLDDIGTMRAGEGAALGRLLLAQLDALEAGIAAAAAAPGRSPEAVAERLRRAVADLFEAVPALDPARLHQEAMLLAMRADVREEVDRLRLHAAAVRSLLDAGGPVGRRLDFLAQELAREANTLCAKAGDAGLTAIGLALRNQIEQFREQVQNLE